MWQLQCLPLFVQILRAQSKPTWLVSVDIALFLSSQYNIEQRQREMEQEKREELHQLIRKSKNEQSEYHVM